MGTWTQGIFDNGMAWASIGDGKKVAIIIPGGPGNSAPPTGWKGNPVIKPFRALMDQGYRLVTVARKRNMPEGYTVEDMARDYAEMIKAEFAGQADLMLGTSTGGMIGQYVAANHPEVFKHFVILVAGCELNPDAEPIDLAFAQALAEDKKFKAGMAIAPALFPDSNFLFLAKIFNGLVSSLLGDSMPHEHFANDIMVEVKAEPNFNARDALPRIKVPVLIIAGDQDYYFSEQIVRETHALIPNSQLSMYEGKGHIGAILDKRIGPDILDFIASNPLPDVSHSG